MALIQGLGDEVVVFVSCVAVWLVGAIAWWSTQVRESSWTRPPTPAGQPLGSDPPAAPADEAAPSTAESPPSAAGPPAEAVDDAPASQPPVEIKLKFLNDSQREVRASLGEKLGPFKRKHFARELAANQRVRLIFNGQVLGGEQSTLGQHGLFANCVVHCLVSPAPQPESPTPAQPTDHLEPDELDLSHLCYPLLGSVLVAIWWCQTVYSQYFSWASTVSLVSLTCIFLASVVHTYWY